MYVTVIPARPAVSPGDTSSPPHPTPPPVCNGFAERKQIDQSQRGTPSEFKLLLRQNQIKGAPVALRSQTQLTLGTRNNSPPLDSLPWPREKTEGGTREDLRREKKTDKTGEDGRRYPIRKYTRNRVYIIYCDTIEDLLEL